MDAGSVPADKADVARLDAKVNILIGLVGGLWVGAGVYFLVNSFGGG